MPEPMTFMGALKAFLEVIHSVWKNGALLLWSCASAALAAFVVLRYTDQFQVAGASALNRDFGIYLLLLVAVLGVFATFKAYSEYRNRPLILIANGRANMWGQTKQTSGEILTAIAVDFQATNVSDKTVKISAVRLCWPWVSRRAILQTMLLIESPRAGDPTYSHDYPILAHTLRRVSVHFTIGHPIGRPGKMMRVTIKVQDHSRKWYWLTFRDVKSAPVPTSPAALVDRR